jgi:hypothetical protein
VGDRHLFCIGIQPIKLTFFFRVCDLKKQEENNNFSKIFDAKTFTIFYETTTNTTKKKPYETIPSSKILHVPKGKEKSS